TQITYDERLRVLTRTVLTGAGPLTTAYAYDPAGNRLSVTLPDGSALAYTYDTAHRLTGVADLFGQRLAYTLDALGDRTQTQVLDAGSTVHRQHTASFDALGRVQQDIGGVSQTTGYAYDNVGNALTITDPLGRVTQRAFDALNRVIMITDPANGVTVTSYDAHDRPTSVTDPNGNMTTYVYDGFGDIIQRTSPDTGTTIYFYDLGGNLVQRVDAAGVVMNLTWDALDRVLTTTYPTNASANVAYSYDESGPGFGIGRLTTVTDAAGTVGYVYDGRGNVLRETRTYRSMT